MYLQVKNEKIMENVESISNKTRKFSRMYILLGTITIRLDKKYRNQSHCSRTRDPAQDSQLFLVYGLYVRRPPGLVFHKIN